MGHSGSAVYSYGGAEEGYLRVYFSPISRFLQLCSSHLWSLLPTVLSPRTLDPPSSLGVTILASSENLNLPDHTHPPVLPAA